MINAINLDWIEPFEINNCSDGFGRDSRTAGRAGNHSVPMWGKQWPC